MEVGRYVSVAWHYVFGNGANGNGNGNGRAELPYDLVRMRDPRTGDLAFRKVYRVDGFENPKGRFAIRAEGNGRTAT